MALHKTMDNFIVPTFVWERCQKYACVSFDRRHIMYHSSRVLQFSKLCNFLAGAGVFHDQRQTVSGMQGVPCSREQSPRNSASEFY